MYSSAAPGQHGLKSSDAEMTISSPDFSIIKIFETREPLKVNAIQMFSIFHIWL